MTISKSRAKIKAIYLLNAITIEKIELHEKESTAYTHLFAFPSGRRFFRYARRAKLRIRCTYWFGGIVMVHLLTQSGEPFYPERSNYDDNESDSKS